LLDPGPLAFELVLLMTERLERTLGVRERLAPPNDPSTVALAMGPRPLDGVSGRTISVDAREEPTPLEGLMS
jgi:hypothetical protein